MAQSHTLNEGDIVPLLYNDQSIEAEVYKINGILYDKLMDVTKEHLLTQKVFLENKIAEIKNGNWYNEWQEMINFPEYYDDSGGSSPMAIGLRQDDTVSLKYPNLPFYSELELKKFGLKHTYETNAYLSDLIVKGLLFFRFLLRD